MLSGFRLLLLRASPPARGRARPGPRPAGSNSSDSDLWRRVPGCHATGKYRVSDSSLEASTRVGTVYMVRGTLNIPCNCAGV